MVEDIGLDWPDVAAIGPNFADHLSRAQKGLLEYLFDYLNERSHNLFTLLRKPFLAAKPDKHMSSLCCYRVFVALGNAHSGCWRL